MDAINSFGWEILGTLFSGISHLGVGTMFIIGILIGIGKVIEDHKRDANIKKIADNTGK